MARRNRRDDFLAAALEAFRERGYEGRSIGDVVGTLGMSKAAFGYHFGPKRLLIELVEPFVDKVEATLDRSPRHPSWPDEGQELLSAYLAVLIEHRDLVIWIDGDKAVPQHQRSVCVWPNLPAFPRGHPGRQSVLGSTPRGCGSSRGFWRPLRDMTEVDAAREKDVMLAAAMAAAETVRAW